MSSARVTLEEFLLNDRHLINPLKRAGARTFDDLLQGVCEEPRGGYFFLTSIRQIGHLIALRILVKLEDEGYITREQFGCVPAKAWKIYEEEDREKALIAQLEALRSKVKELEARLSQVS